VKSATVFEPSTVDVYRHDRDNLVVGYKNVIVQIRNGRLTLEALDHIHSMGKLLLSRHAGPCGALLVVEDGALFPDPDVRRAQTRVVRELFGFHPRCHVAGVLAGKGLGMSLLRSGYRFLLMGQPRLHSCNTIPAAARWLGPAIGRPSDELVALGEWARSVAGGAASPC
jgi:hypothetical protein